MLTRSSPASGPAIFGSARSHARLICSASLRICFTSPVLDATCTPPTIAAMSAAARTTLDRWFKLTEHGTTTTTELRAGLLSFISCSYLLFVIPHLLTSHLPPTTPPAQAALFAARVCTGVALTSGVATALSAALTNYPVTLTPGLGIATYMASLLPPTTTHAAWAAAWGEALACGGVAGGVLLLLACCLPLHRLVRHLLPPPIKLAAMCGLGVLVALGGLRMAGLVVWGGGGWEVGGAGVGVAVACVGFVVIALLLVCEVRGGMLLGVLITTLLYYAAVGRAPVWPGLAVADLRPSSAVSLHGLSIGRSAAPVLSFLLLALFDITALIHTVAVLTPLQQHKERWVYVVSAVTTILASFYSAPPLIVAVESVVGVKEGGRTGLTALTSACLFLLSLLVVPLFSSSLIPAVATAPLLLLIGSFLFAEVSRIDLSSPQSSLPAFVCIVLVPFTQSLAVGVVAGWLVWAALAVGVRVAGGRWLGVMADVLPFAVCFSSGGGGEGVYMEADDGGVLHDEAAEHEALLRESELMGEPLYSVTAATTQHSVGRQASGSKVQGAMWEYEPIECAEGSAVGPTRGGERHLVL